MRDSPPRSVMRLASLSLCLLAVLPAPACKRQPALNTTAAPEPGPGHVEVRKPSDPHSRRQPVGKFERSRYRSSGGFSGIRSLEIDGLNSADIAGERALAARLVERLESAGYKPEQFREVLAEARMLETGAIIDVAAKAMTHPDPEIRAEAILMVEGMGGVEVMPLVRAGMTDDSEEIRRLTVEMARSMRGAEAAEVVGMALADGDEGVRQLGFHLAMNQSDSERWRVLADAVASPYADLALAGLAEAEATPSADFVPAMAGALDHPDVEVRETAHEILYLHFHQSFSSAAEARQWWAGNRGRFDAHLVGREESP